MSSKYEISQLLVSMNFDEHYVGRAFKVYENNYGHSYNVEVLTEIIIRLQNKDRYAKKAFDASIITLAEAHRLMVHDSIDHRDCAGRFTRASVIQKNGTNLKIHYSGWSKKWNTWCDYKKELWRFAHHCSISRRHAHRYKQLKEGDSIKVKKRPNQQWQIGVIKQFDKHSGQIQVECAYKLHWFHLDDISEVAAITKRRVTPKQNKRKRKLDDLRDASDKIPSRKKRKLNKEKNDDNPWSKILKSKEEHIPQWIQCIDCNKRRIILVLTQDIVDWKPSLDWKCDMNDAPYNKCRLPQQTDMLLRRKYCEIQLNALDIQRKINQNKDEDNSSDNESTEEDTSSKTIQDAVPLSKHNDICDALKKENKRLREQNKSEMDEMKKKLNLYQGKSEKVNTMNLKELDALEVSLQNGMNVIKEARERLLENALSCIVCLKNQKNVVIQECGHFDLCSQCERTLPSKICPRCQKTFKDVIVINH